VEAVVLTVVEASVQTAMEAVVLAAVLAAVTHPPRNSLNQPLKETEIKATLAGPLRSELVQLVHGLQNLVKRNAKIMVISIQFFLRVAKLHFGGSLCHNVMNF
jgi:hypothetical protein